MKKILLYPGAFNPPHLGHASIIEIAVKRVPFDEIWIMPSGNRSDKAISTTYENRRKLNELFVDHLKSQITVPVKLITAELDDIDGRNTPEIIQEIKSQPGTQVTQLIGLDGFLSLRPKLVAGEKFLVVKRQGYEMSIDPVSADDILILDRMSQDISSTTIRKMVQEHNLEYKALVPKEVGKYIEENKLYLSK